MTADKSHCADCCCAYDNGLCSAATVEDAMRKGQAALTRLGEGK